METFFGDFYTPNKTKPKVEMKVFDKEKEKAYEAFRKERPNMAFPVGWNTYKNFKKSHRMIAW